MKEIWGKIKKNLKKIVASIGIATLLISFLEPIAENIVNSIFNFIFNYEENSLKYLEGNVEIIDDNSLVGYREGIVSPLQSMEDSDKTVQEIITSYMYTDLTDPFQKGCTLNAFISNDTNEDIAISKCSLIIEKIQNVKKANPVFLAYIEGNKLKFIVVNNGNDILPEGKVSIIGEYYDKLQNLKQVNEFDLSSLFLEHDNEISIPSLEKGEILEISSWKMDDFSVKQWRENVGSWLTLYGKYEETESGKVWDDIFIGALDYATSPNFFRGQGGAGDYVIKRFVILDIEKNSNLYTKMKKEVSIPTEFYIGANSDKNIQISILPNMSCNISFYAVFSAAGENEIKTELFEHEIIVPVYENNGNLYINLINCVKKKHIRHYLFNSDTLIQKEIEYNPYTMLD